MHTGTHLVALDVGTERQFVVHDPLAEPIHTRVSACMGSHPAHFTRPQSVRLWSNRKCAYKVCVATVRLTENSVVLATWCGYSIPSENGVLNIICLITMLWLSDALKTVR